MESEIIKEFKAYLNKEFWKYKRKFEATGNEVYAAKAKAFDEASAKLLNIENPHLDELVQAHMNNLNEAIFGGTKL